VKYVAFIPARKNSKRLKKKNILKISQKSLVDIAINSTKNIKKITKVVISSDDEQILKKKSLYSSKKFFFVKRKKKLSHDRTSLERVILDYLLNDNSIEKPENIILLQPTSPLRNSKHIQDSINFFEENKYDSVLSGYLDKVFMWNINTKKSLTYNYKSRKNSQFMNRFFFENGAIFIFNTKNFLQKKSRLFGKIGFYTMNKYDSIDIDDKEDLKIARKLYQ
jgi:CMP-N,N'-diacetyllegionaminic acid synthase